MEEQDRPILVNLALTLLAVVAVADVARSVTEQVGIPAGGTLALTAASLVVNVGLLVAIAYRRWWAVMVTALLTVLGIPATLMRMASGLGGHPAEDLILVALSVVAVGLLLIDSSREWFKSGTPTSAMPADWYADPSSRYEYRYWDGTVWTAQVATQGQQAIDPLPAPSDQAGPFS